MRQSLLPLKIDLIAQANIKQRDIAFNKDIYKTTIIIEVNAYRLIIASITRILLSQPQERKLIDIAGISRLAFSLNIYR